MYYVIQCRFSEFLIQLCTKNAFSLGPCRNITTMCRKIAFFGVRAEILLAWDQGVPGFSCRAIFGVREEILIFRRNIHLCDRGTLQCYYHILIAKNWELWNTFINLPCHQVLTYYTVSLANPVHPVLSLCTISKDCFFSSDNLNLAPGRERQGSKRVLQRPLAGRQSG